MDFFLLMNVFCFVVNGILLYSFIKRMPHLLVKPSILFLVINYCIIQFPSVLYAPKTYSEMASHWDYFVLSQLFPLFVLLISLCTFNSSAIAVWKRLQKGSFRYDKKAGAIYFCAAAIIVAIYLWYVGITNTGIYAVLFDPANSTWAREQSFKLLDSQLIKYAYILLSSAILPVITAMFALQIPAAWKQKKVFGLFLMMLCVFVCFVFISFPGNRWGPLVLVLAIFMAYGYYSLFKFFNWSNLILLAGILLATMIGITLMREGVDLAQIDIWDYFFAMSDESEILKGNGGLFWVAVSRAFLMPMKVGWDYLSHVEMYGYWGIAAIPKIAVILGVEPTNVSNLMNQYLYPDSPYRFVSSYPAGFIFSYYSYFGMGSILFSLLCIICLDIIVFLYVYLNRSLLIPVLATVSVAIISLTSCDFTTALLSHGVVSSVLGAIVVQYAAIPAISMFMEQSDIRSVLGTRLKKLIFSVSRKQTS